MPRPCTHWHDVLNCSPSSILPTHCSAVVTTLPEEWKPCPPEQRRICLRREHVGSTHMDCTHLIGSEGIGRYTIWK